MHGGRGHYGGEAQGGGCIQCEAGEARKSQDGKYQGLSMSHHGLVIKHRVAKSSNKIRAIQVITVKKLCGNIIHQRGCQRLEHKYSQGFLRIQIVLCKCWFHVEKIPENF